MKETAKIVELNWDAEDIALLVRNALAEDLVEGAGFAAVDHTAHTIVDAHATASARIVAKQKLILAGLPLAERIFRQLDAAIRVERNFEEGAQIPSDAVVAQVQGSARAILTGERTALNFLARLSGVATCTRQFVDAIAGTRARIRDTRKTTPLLRALEKYAVRLGGGVNHRFGLYDAMLIKENHIALAGSVTEAIRRAHEHQHAHRETTAYESFGPGPAREVLPIQVEVRNEAELREALSAGADSVLLDNLLPTQATAFVTLVRRERATCLVEISGGVTLANVRAYADSGADFIAIGALTHSAPAADFSLLVESPSA
ncbi:MAG: carboxylating nicotinate-nucleotide diphosphorylase [Acidobacteria bacterium]|nr:carboxylating nicotinate-nucleotide diphosphorylase [Acidobacteriota bacterium]MCL5289314.1 carboxylating nicotinate-nucleotide diphosphorylase [Acidobacteriota bacterium]